MCVDSAKHEREDDAERDRRADAQQSDDDEARGQCQRRAAHSVRPRFHKTRANPAREQALPQAESKARSRSICPAI